MDRERKKGRGRREEKEWSSGERAVHQERLSQVEGGENHGKHIGMDSSPQSLINTDLHTTHTCTLRFWQISASKGNCELG